MVEACGAPEALFHRSSESGDALIPTSDAARTLADAAGLRNTPGATHFVTCELGSTSSGAFFDAMRVDANLTVDEVLLLSDEQRAAGEGDERFSALSLVVGGSYLDMEIGTAAWHIAVGGRMLWFALPPGQDLPYALRTHFETWFSTQIAESYGSVGVGGADAGRDEGDDEASDSGNRRSASASERSIALISPEYSTELLESLHVCQQKPGDLVAFPEDWRRWAISLEDVALLTRRAGTGSGRLRQIRDSLLEALADLGAAEDTAGTVTGGDVEATGLDQGGSATGAAGGTAAGSSDGSSTDGDGSSDDAFDEMLALEQELEAELEAELAELDGDLAEVDSAGDAVESQRSVAATIIRDLELLIELEAEAYPKKTPFHIKTILARAYALGRYGQLSKSEAEFRKAYKIDPSNTDVAYSLATTIVASKNYKQYTEAEALLRKVVSHDKNNGHALMALASVLIALSRSQAGADVTDRTMSSRQRRYRRDAVRFARRSLRTLGLKSDGHGRVIVPENSALGPDVVARWHVTAAKTIINLGDDAMLGLNDESQRQAVVAGYLCAAARLTPEKNWEGVYERFGLEPPGQECVVEQQDEEETS